MLRDRADSLAAVDGILRIGVIRGLRLLLLLSVDWLSRLWLRGWDLLIRVLLRLRLGVRELLLKRYALSSVAALDVGWWVGGGGSVAGAVPVQVDHGEDRGDSPENADRD